MSTGHCLVHGGFVGHACPVCVTGGGLFVQQTTASDLTAEQWKAAWMLAAPVVQAARRYINAEREGNGALIEDAHFQLLRALTDYDAKQVPGA